MLTVVAASLVVFAGFAVGVTSIGGIFVVPTLTAIGGVPLREAIAASNFSFAFGGAAALILKGRRRVAVNVAGSAAAPASFYWAALIGAAFGALTLQWLPLALVRVVVAFLAVLSGVLALRPARGVSCHAVELCRTVVRVRIPQRVRGQRISSLAQRRVRQ